jgi:hypothetical protein
VHSNVSVFVLNHTLTAPLVRPRFRDDDQALLHRPLGPHRSPGESRAQCSLVGDDPACRVSQPCLLSRRAGEGIPPLGLQWTENSRCLLQIGSGRMLVGIALLHERLLEGII